MKSGESFKDLLGFASGFNDLAYTASVNVLQKTGKELKVQDVKFNEYGTYKPKSGDEFRITKILTRYENRITIQGAVFRPNTYSFYEGMRVSDLITQAEGLKEDAYRTRALIVRLKTDLTTEMVNVNLANALAGDADANVPLKKEDQITVYSILDMREEYKVTIDGEVKTPGVFDYHENMTLYDLVVESGGLSGSASKKVEIARMIKAEEIDDKNPSRIELYNLELTPENKDEVKNFVLLPFDVVNVRRKGVYEKPQMVSISGAVAYPGKYVLANKKEKVYDVIERAGGLTSIANLYGVQVKRPIKKEQIAVIESVDLNLGKNDSIQRKIKKKVKEDLKFSTIPLNWQKILKNINSETNVTLFPGDSVVVAQFNEGVKVTGNVLLTSEIPYQKGRYFGYYIRSVGGIDAKGWRKKAYIIYPNGQAKVARTFLFYTTYPTVQAGSQIVVPEKPQTKKMTTGEIIGIASVLSSMALLFITAFK